MDSQENPHPPPDDLAAQLAEAQARLAEAEETLEAIRTGGVDALVVAGPTGERVFSLQGAETPYRLLVEEINEGALLLRPDGTILYANARFAQLAGSPLEQVIGSPWRRFFPPAEHPRLETLLKAAQRGGIREEFSLESQAGAARPIEVSLSLLKGAQAETLSAIVADLTERKAAEDALRQANEKLETRVQQRTAELTRTNESLRTEMEERKRAQEARAMLAGIVESSRDAIISKDLTGKVTSWNAAAEHLFGYRAEEMIGQPITRIIPPELQAEEAAILARLRCGEPVVNFESVRLAKDGHRIPVSLTISPTYDRMGLIVGGATIARDITERKRTELELAGLREQLAEELSAMSRLHDLGTRFVRLEDSHTLLGAILDAGIAIIGAKKGYIQLMNPSSEELRITIHRGFDRAFVEFFSHVGAGKAACGTAMQTKRCVIVEDVTLSPLFLVEPRALQLKLAAGVRALVCTPLLTHAGQLLGVLSAHFPAPHRPSERDLRLLELLARQAADFIERVQAEEALRAARKELVLANAVLEEKVRERTAQLQETVGELEHFSYTITHDMRAPLRAMRGLGGILQEECAECLHPVRREYLRRIADSADRMDRLITDALQYSGVLRQEVKLEPVDTGALLRGILESYPQFQPPHANVRIDGPLPLVLGNQAALIQCFSNLLGNAVKFVHLGITPEVRVWAEEVRNAECGVRNEAPGLSDSQLSTLNSQLPCVRLWFEDQGIGIETQYQDRIWQMFQQLNKSYEGTGIGLALVRKGVERMGGKVGVESEPGKGSRFWIELKEANAEPQAGSSTK